MADDYARHALSQRAAFEATHPAALDAARLFADEPVLRVVDLGAADGVNSHGLIRELAEERAGRPLIYALVDLPTNVWRVAADHLPHAFGGAADGSEVVIIPAPGDAGPGVADAGTGAHYASPEAHGEACRRAVEHDPPPAMVISMAGVPLHRAPCLPSGSVHVAVSGTAMHWVADASGLASTGSVFPGYPDHIDGAERRAWRVAAERQWERLLEMRALELARGGRFVAALPASPAPCPERRGLYVELIGDMNRLLADWRRTGRIGAATVAAVVVPVWMRTLDEIRRPFEERGGSVAGLELESAELFRSGQSLLARRSRRLRAGLCAERDRMGQPAPPPRLRERGRGPRPRSPRRLSRRARGARRGCPRPLPLGLHRGPRHLPEGGWQRAPPDALMKLASPCRTGHATRLT